MDTKQQVIDYNKNDLKALWNLMKYAVEDKNIQWIKNILKSIEYVESNLKRLQQEIIIG